MNPTIPLCFWCGGQKNEIALLGKLPGDEAAPMSTWLIGDYEPCDKCKELRQRGIDLVEAADHPVIHEQQPPWHGAYPTGRHMIVTEEAIKRIFTPECAQRLCQSRIGFLDKEAYDRLSMLDK